MIQQLLHHDPANGNLLLIFLGWSGHADMLAGLRCPGCDVMAVYDYRDEAFCADALAPYRHVYLFAWSMGVMMAERVAARCPALRPAVAIAVNGSPTPVDDQRGIPHAIFNSTLAGLCEASLAKFQRRMCGDARRYAALRAAVASRPVDELREELRRLGERASEAATASGAAAAPAIAWDRAIIADDDRIFPPSNLRRAWAALTRVRTVGGGHLPDWPTIVSQEIIDKDYLAQKFQRSLPTYDGEATVQAHVARRLWQLWRSYLGPLPGGAAAGPLPTIVEAGCGTGLLTRLYAPALRPRRLLLWDLCPAPAAWPAAAEVTAGDAEELIEQLPPAGVDAVASASTMQWFNSPAAFIANAARALAPGGFLVVATFGERNFRELAAITRLPLRYLALDELTAALPDGMRFLAAEQEEIVLTFPTPKHVMRHLRATGVNGLRAVGLPLSRLLASYPAAADGSAPLTYHPLYLIAQKLPR